MSEREAFGEGVPFGDVRRATRDAFDAFERRARVVGGRGRAGEFRRGFWSEKFVGLTARDAIVARAAGMVRIV